MTAKCCLCGNNGSSLVDKIKTSDITKIYMHLFSVNIDKYFNESESIFYYRCNVCDLLFFSPPVSGDEQFYDHLQQFEWYYTKNKEEFVFAEQFIKPDDHVLEVGCGGGWFGKILEPCNYLGLEVNTKAKLIANKNMQNVIIQTVEDHAINSRELYDVVCSFQVLEHVVNPESFVRSCVDCLKPGGLLILSVPSEDSYLAIVEDGILNMPPHHLTRWTDKTLTWMANRFNLEIISLKHEPLADIHVHAYATEMIRALIKRIFHQKFEIISTTVPHRFLTYICQILGKYYSTILSNPGLRPVGHSVTMVLKKVTHL